MKFLKSFGNIQAFVAFDREPTTTDYNHVSSGYDDIIGPVGNYLDYSLALFCCHFTSHHF